MDEKKVQWANFGNPGAHYVVVPDETKTVPEKSSRPGAVRYTLGVAISTSELAADALSATWRAFLASVHVVNVAAEAAVQSGEDPEEIRGALMEAVERVPMPLRSCLRSKWYTKGG